ncbi:MAG: NnrS family protein, partial [Betaproteobacteria bacterium]|nr:NnrS family protein [Betaproteobacteria bacterium]
TTALHVITIGSLGTLTLNVMATSWVLKARAGPAHQARLRVGATALVGGATLARALADFAVFDRQLLLLFAATAWTGAFGLLLLMFALVRPQPRTRRDEPGG